MEFTLLSSASLTFATYAKTADGTMTVKKCEVKVDKLGQGSSANLLNKLEHLLLVQGKPLSLSQPMDSRLMVLLFYGALSAAVPNRKQTGCFKIADFDKSNGLLKRLGSLCGGHNNIQACVEMGVGTNKKKEENRKVTFKDLTMKCVKDEVYFGTYFNFTESLAQKWNTPTEFTGTLSLSLKLNHEAVNLIHVGDLGINDLINRKLLETAMETGDGIIEVENGKEIRCHKAILSAHSDVFRAMFRSDMKEGKSSRVTMSDMSEAGVKALLDYLYCCDIREALNNSLIAVELLRAADKYGIDKLLETMKDLILAKEGTWFSVDAAVQLFKLVKNRADSAEFKEMENKAKLLLKSKRMSELKKCAEFCELFDNSDNAMDMWSYFMENQ